MRIQLIRELARFLSFLAMLIVLLFLSDRNRARRFAY